MAYILTPVKFHNCCLYSIDFLTIVIEISCYSLTFYDIQMYIIESEAITCYFITNLDFLVQYKCMPVVH